MFPVRMSIVTYNLWGTERWLERSPALRRFCTTYRPDVMGVQELSVESGALIDEALPDHARVEDDFSGWTTEGNIWWNNELFELITYGAEDIGIEAPGDRRLFWVRLQLRDRPRTLWVGSLHLTAADTSKELDEGWNSRVSETKRAVDALDRVVDTDEPAFLVGDFNDALAPLAHLFGAGFHSCFARLAQLPPPTMPAFGDRLLEYGFSPTSSTTGSWPTATPERCRPRHLTCSPTTFPRPTTGRSTPSTNWRAPNGGRRPPPSNC